MDKRALVNEINKNIIDAKEICELTKKLYQGLYKMRKEAVVCGLLENENATEIETLLSLNEEIADIASAITLKQKTIGKAITEVLCP